LVRIPGYRSRGPRFDSSLSLVSTIEELLGRNSSGYGSGDPEVVTRYDRYVFRREEQIGVCMQYLVS
jgi:hypothetical protein